MAQAMKCDRPGCGQYYQYYGGRERTDGGPVEPNGGGLTCRTKSRKYECISGESYDLCPACLKKLQHWLNGNGELEEAE